MARKGSGTQVSTFLVIYYPALKKIMNIMVYFHIHLCKRHINVYNLYPLTLIEIILNPDFSVLKMFSSAALFYLKPRLSFHFEMPPTII